MSLRIKGPGLVRPGFAYIDVNVPVCLVAGVHSAKKRNHSNLARDASLRRKFVQKLMCDKGELMIVLLKRG